MCPLEPHGTVRKLECFGGFFIRFEQIDTELDAFERLSTTVERLAGNRLVLREVFVGIADPLRLRFNPFFVGDDDGFQLLAKVGLWSLGQFLHVEDEAI